MSECVTSNTLLPGSPMDNEKREIQWKSLLSHSMEEHFLLLPIAQVVFERFAVSLQYLFTEISEKWRPFCLDLNVLT